MLRGFVVHTEPEASNGFAIILVGKIVLLILRMGRNSAISVRGNPMKRKIQ